MIEILNSGYILNHVYDDGQPLFEEYAYILNLDDNTFQYYVTNKMAQKFDLNNLPSW